MRRIAIGVGLTGAGLLLARALAPKLRERAIAGCERMFEQMPESFPPRRILRGVEETRADTARILELLERRQARGSVPADDVSETAEVAHAT